MTGVHVHHAVATSPGEQLHAVQISDLMRIETSRLCFCRFFVFRRWVGFLRMATKKKLSNPLSYHIPPSFMLRPNGYQEKVE